jgi:hypothetical protein
MFSKRYKGTVRGDIKNFWHIKELTLSNAWRSIGSGSSRLFDAWSSAPNR